MAAPSGTPAPIWNVQFGGSAVIAGHLLSADIYLKDGSPGVLVLQGIPAIQISAIFNHFFQPALTWPAELLDLSLANTFVLFAFLPGPQLSQLRLLPQLVVDRQSKLTAQGLFIATTVSLTIDTVDIDFDSTITVLKGAGFGIEAALKQPVILLDANFLQLSDPGFAAGPSLSVQAFPNGSRKMALGCAYTLFGEQFGESDLLVTTDAAGKLQLTAKLSLTGVIGPFTDPSLTLTWSKARGFGVEDFPHIPIPNVVLDFVKLLKDAFASKQCGNVANFGLKQAVETHFFAKPTVSTTLPAGSNAKPGQIYVTVEGFYKISALGNLVGTVALPTLVFSLALPGDFKFDTIAAKILSTITDNGEAVVRQLADDPAQLSKFLAVFLSQQAFEKLTGELACDLLKKFLEDFIQDFIAELLGDTIGDALAAALAALLALKVAGSPGDSAAPLLPAPAISGMVFRNGAVIATWTGVANAAGYAVSLTDPKSRPAAPLQNVDASARSATFPLNVESIAEGTCTAAVVALASLDRPEANSDPGTASILKLSNPQSVTATANVSGGTLIAQWSPVPSASQYNVIVRHGPTNTVAATAEVATPATTGQFVVDKLLVRAAGDYLVGVQALAGEDAIASATADAGAAIPMLAAPASVSQRALADRLQVNWSPVVGAAGYRIVVNEVAAPTEAFRTSISLANAGTGAILGQDLLFSNFTSRGAGRYLALVNASGDSHHLSGPAASAASIDVLFTGIGFTTIGSTFVVS